MTITKMNDSIFQIFYKDFQAHYVRPHAEMAEENYDNGHQCLSDWSVKQLKALNSPSLSVYFIELNHKFESSLN